MKNQLYRKDYLSRATPWSITLEQLPGLFILSNSLDYLSWATPWIIYLEQLPGVYTRSGYIEIWLVSP
jgi:hypothetical protein